MQCFVNQCLLLFVGGNWWNIVIGLETIEEQRISKRSSYAVLKCYYDQIFDYHFFSLDWQFSTWSTWCANYSFMRLRKVVFFGAQKPLIFVRHWNAMFLWPGYQEHKAIALWRHLLNAVHTAWQFSSKNFAQQCSLSSHFDAFLFRKTLSILLH